MVLLKLFSSTMTYAVNIEYQNLGSPAHQKQDRFNTARCLETIFHILTFVLIILL